MMRLLLVLALTAAAGCGSPRPTAPELPKAREAIESSAAFDRSLALGKSEKLSRGGSSDPRAYRRRVDALAIEVGDEARSARSSQEKAEAVARVFYGHHDFSANPADPEGEKPESFDVATAVTSGKAACLPIAIVIARAASGAGITAGVARVPGHALVAVGPEGDRAYLDPAERGTVRTWAYVAQRWPWSPQAATLYDGRPLRADEVVAQLRANLAAIRVAEGRLAEAEKHAQGALSVVKDLPEALVSLAAVDLKRGEIDRALERLNRAHDLVPQSAVVLYNLGLAAAARGRTIEAISFYQAALDADPRMERARANKAALEKTQGR